MRHNHGCPARAREDRGWIVVVPAKPLHRAKSRMAAELPTAERRLLVRAMLGDVLDAVAATEAVSAFAVVTSDPELAALARALGAEIVEEPRDNEGLEGREGQARGTHAPRGETSGELADAPASGTEQRAGIASTAVPVVSGGDSTFRRAAALGLGWATQRGDRVAVVASDLPGLTADALADVLAEAADPAIATNAGGRGFVPDTEGLGTTIATFAGTADLRTYFGPRSAAGFADSGAAVLDGVSTSRAVQVAAAHTDTRAETVQQQRQRRQEQLRRGLRRDVDSVAHFAEIDTLGTRTAEALGRVAKAASDVMPDFPRTAVDRHGTRSAQRPPHDAHGVSPDRPRAPRAAFGRLEG